jgi:molybdopterin molybdotransferase
VPELLILKSAEEARAILRGFAPLGVEDVAFDHADGRVLAAPLPAPENLPAWPRAVMDGYAVRARDTVGASDAVPTSLRVRGSVAMGESWAGAPPDGGEAIAVPTGAVVPEPCDAVVMIEHTRPGAGDEIEVRRPVAPGENLARVGDDLRRGEVVLEAGRRLRPADVGVLAALGIIAVTVYRRPRVAILSTGNEVVPPQAAPRPGQVRDVNAVVMAAQARRAGCDVVHGGIVGDDAAALMASSAELLERADVLLLSGGSSVGVRDLTAGVLEGLGAEMLFHGISVRPGKPTILARIGAKPVLGMPGVPASATVIFDAFVRPLLWRLGGEPTRESWPARRRARLARRVPSIAGREDYVRVRLVGERAEPVTGGSSSLSALVRADGLVVVPADAEAIAEGEDVDVCLSI